MPALASSERPAPFSSSLARGLEPAASITVSVLPTIPISTTLAASSASPILSTDFLGRGLVPAALDGLTSSMRHAARLEPKTRDTTIVQYGYAESWSCGTVPVHCMPSLLHSSTRTNNSARPEHTKRTQGDAGQRKATHARQTTPTQQKQQATTRKPTTETGTVLVPVEW